MSTNKKSMNLIALNIAKWKATAACYIKEDITYFPIFAYIGYMDKFLEGYYDSLDMNNPYERCIFAEVTKHLLNEELELLHEGISNRTDYTYRDISIRQKRITSKIQQLKTNLHNVWLPITYWCQKYIGNPNRNNPHQSPSMKLASGYRIYL
jgi:hypothetical protein